jgi:hypothetical protein
MGNFIDVEGVKELTRHDSIRAMNTTQIEDLLIGPAERTIEDEFSLDLNTDAVPADYEAVFEAYPNRLTQFQTDMKRAAILLIDRMETNPDGFSNQSVRGASVAFGRRIPPEISALVGRWSSGSTKTGRVFRT